MKYYSELTKKVYDTEEELKKVEKEYHKEQEEKEKALATKKEEAKAVTQAYKEMESIRQKYQEAYREANKKFVELRNAFVNKYGSWHMTYSVADEGDDYFETTLRTAIDLINRFLD